VRVLRLSLRRDLGRPRTIAALTRAALRLECCGVVYSGGLENRPVLLRRLERRAPILGNGPGIVAAVRDPERFFPFLRGAGLPHPRTLARSAAPGATMGTWLFKPLRSGGGVRVRRARAGEPCPRGFYRQELVRGLPGSVAFVADGRRAAILGVTRQLAGARFLGGDGFRYGGNIAGPPARLLSPKARRILYGAVAAIARRFGLRGLNGIDFVLENDVPRLLEVNPRYTASMELFEDLSGRCLFDLHLEALARGRLPAPPLRVRRFLAKGIVYARSRVAWPWSGEIPGMDVRDRPEGGEIVEAGEPLCTIVVPGRSISGCRRRLREAAALLRRGLAGPGRRGAARPVAPPGRLPASAVRAARRSVLR